MGNFDDILKSKTESFSDGSSPSQTELNRLNSSLDLLVTNRRVWRRYLLWSLLLLLLFSQLYLILTNRTLRKEIVEDRQSWAAFVDSQQVEFKNLSDQLKTMGSNPKPSDENEVLEKVDSHGLAIKYIENNKGLIEKLARELANEQTKELLAALRNFTNGSQQTQTPFEANTSLAEPKPLNTSTTSAIAKNKGRNDKNEGNGQLNKTGNSASKSSRRIDTIVIKEIAIDSSLYDSLVEKINGLRDETASQPTKIKPKPASIAWTTAFGVKPSYSNLYLLNGRLVYDGHLTTGINYNDRLALNAGIKYRGMRVHDDLDENAQNPVADFEQFPDEIKLPFELEGSAHGFYVPLDLQYFVELGSLRTFGRAGLDLNILTRENYKIEYEPESEFRLEQVSR